MALQLRRNVDFTKGNIFKSLLLFAIPIMLGEVFQNLYHSTDSVVLGNFAGDSALAAVSSRCILKITTKFIKQNNDMIKLTIKTTIARKKHL